MAKQYQELKYRLASKFKHDRLGYSEAKTKFIQGALARATAWRNPGQ